jgi:hypothetical protein
VKIKPSEVKMETSAENLGSKNGGYEEEIKAMEEIGNALKKLEQAGRNNVLQWAINHFLTADSGRTPIFSKTAPVAVSNLATPKDSSFPDLPNLFDSAAPKSRIEKALVTGYWVQECQGNSDFVSQDINNQLKDLGHRVGNITAVFNGLISSNLVMQIRKSGNTQQARKKYKLTREGIKFVQKMLQGIHEE